MLQHLSIRNFILIDELDLDFEKGFCVITGETGAGKSIILEAILFCLGYKSSVLPSGEQKTVTVAAVFGNIPADVRRYLIDLGIELGNDLVIKRVQTNSKIKKIFINDQPVIARTLEHIVAYLFEIHGQNSHISLLSSSAYLDILDDFGGLKNDVYEVMRLYKKLQETEQAIAEGTAKKEITDHEIDYLSFVIDELTKFDIKPNEEQELENLRHELRIGDKEKKLVIEIIKNAEESGIAANISKILRLLARQNTESESWKKISDHLEDAYSNIESAISELKSRLNIADSKHSLEEIEDRLFAIKDMARKYKVQACELPSFTEKSKYRLAELQNGLERAHNLDLEITFIKNNYDKRAEILSQKRHEAAGKLEIIVQHSLSQLQMAKTIFKIAIEIDENYRSSKGIDRVTFMASINPGTPMVPINKAASGGELARFMLALKTALFDKYQKPLMIFDEIDIGIGGSTADSVGDHLKKLSTGAQVLVITHQAQIAGKANQHILVQKMQLKNQTNITVKSLEQHERIHEIARMISGNKITPAALKTAEELLSVT